MTNFPVIDLSGTSDSASARQLVCSQACDAAQEYGFFYISGHGIPASLIESVFDASRRFFALSEESKSTVAVSKNHRGFIRQGASVMDGYDGADCKESYIWGLDTDAGSNGSEDRFSMLAPNRWHDELPDMRLVLNEFCEQSHDLAMRLLQVLAIGLGRTGDVFSRNFRQPTSRGSLIYYPPSTNQHNSYGVSPHTDFGCLSLLIQGDEGLQVETEGGDWLDLPPIPGTIVANIGDLLERWSNGVFRSVPHCVVNKKSTARYSVVVFVDPDADTLIDPLPANGGRRNFEPVRCDTYIASRFDRAFDYRK